MADPCTAACRHGRVRVEGTSTAPDSKISVDTTGGDMSAEYSSDAALLPTVKLRE
jgi:hypothetical protein